MSDLSLHDAAPTLPAVESRRPRTGSIFLRLHAGPLVGAVAAALLAFSAGTPVEAFALVYTALLVGSALTSRRRQWADLLRFTGALARAAGPVAGVGLVVAEQALLGLPGLSAPELLTVLLVAAMATVLGEHLASYRGWDHRTIRIAMIGSASAADSLQFELQAARRAGHKVIGRVRSRHDGAAPENEGDVPLLGELADLGRIVRDERIDLLLMGADVPRLAVFDEIARSCLHLPVRLQELSNFYEHVFGHVPVSEINAAWFQYIVHPNYRTAPPAGKRLLDLTIAVPASLVALPLIALFAIFIRRDGGPALFRQQRIGEGGRAFTIFKLRTMLVGSSAEWSKANDARVTGIGRLLRKTHLDELPQLYNVLRGEMSLVGPRPEQPAFVEKLEESLPFYSRRHLVKPGLTGWAQVRCGYAGSDIGSAWKLCHDLYYLKHRSVRLDVVILAETVRTLVADRQYDSAPATVSFLTASQPPLVPVGQPAPADGASGSAG